jgi:hypothetical protein
MIATRERGNGELSDGYRILVLQGTSVLENGHTTM